MNAARTVGALAALAHENRLAIYRMLVERGPVGLPAGAIAERLGIRPSSLTFHLQHLLRAHLVTQRRASRQLIYAADFATMNRLVAFLTENCCAAGDCCGPGPQAASARGPACEPAATQDAEPLPTRRTSA